VGRGCEKLKEEEGVTQVAGDVMLLLPKKSSSRQIGPCGKKSGRNKGVNGSRWEREGQTVKGSVGQPDAASQ
jgi:hypothetical protein